jgi:hypothetical protein
MYGQELLNPSDRVWIAGLLATPSDPIEGRCPPQSYALFSANGRVRREEGGSQTPRWAN